MTVITDYPPISTGNGHHNGGATPIYTQPAAPLAAQALTLSLLNFGKHNVQSSGNGYHTFIIMAAR